MKFVQNLALILATTLTFTLFAEGVLFVMAGFRGGDSGSGPYKHDDLYVSRVPVASFDIVRGYRRMSGENRVVRVVKDTIVFDQTFDVNNEQFISSIDYKYKRDSDNTFRFVVFGDSFTDADYMPVPWPARLNAHFSNLSSNELKGVEFYSFAVNGAGLSNWHSIFFNEVVLKYDFDAIIIASYGDNLARPFSILDYENDKSLIGRFGKPPRSIDEYLSSYKPRLEHHYAQVWSGEAIDTLIESYEKGVRWVRPALTWRLLDLVDQQIKRISEEVETRDPAGSQALKSDGITYSIEEFESSYGVGQIGQLWSMIDYAKARSIPVVLAAVPSRDRLISWLSSHESRPPSHQIEIKSIAQHLDLLFFDGYRPFSGLPAKAIQERFWLTYDGHWNQAGSDRFADAMTTYLEKTFEQYFQSSAQTVE